MTSEDAPAGLEILPGFWTRQEVRGALRERQMGRLLQLVKDHAGASQTRIGAAVGLTQGRVSDYIRGDRRVTELETFERIAEGLGMPDDARMILGLAPRWPELLDRTQTASSRGPAASPAPMRAMPVEARVGLAYSPSLVVTLNTVTKLGRGDVKRREMIVQAPFAVAALASTSRDWLLASLQGEAGRGKQAGIAQVEAIRETFRVFQEADVLKGGGRSTRVALAQYLTGVVIPMLRERHREDVHQALCEAASEQTYLAGWMAFDDGQHGLAQRYLTQSLRLAQAAGNNVLGSHVLAGMSDQATQLAHPSEGLQLARAGRQALSGWNAPAALTDLYTLEARALAALGRGREAATAIDAAERSFDRIAPANEPEWARFIDTAYVSGEIANCFRDLERPEEAGRFARESIRASARQNRARRGALSQAVLAVSHVQAGDVDAAISAGSKAMRLSRSVESARCTFALADLETRLMPYRDEPDVLGFLHELRHSVN